MHRKKRRSWSPASKVSAWLLLAIAGAFLATVGCGDDDGGANNLNNQNNDNTNLNTNDNTNDNTNTNTNDNTNTNNNTSGLTIQEYCERDVALAQPWCDYADQCCTGEDQQAIEFSLPACRFGPKTVTDCVDWINERITAGTIEFNGEAAQDCLDAQAAWIPTPPATCSGTMKSEWGLTNRDRPAEIQIPSCRSTYVGLLQLGDECTADAECEAGLICTDMTGNYDYQCDYVSSEYGSCSVDSDCEYGLHCIGDPDLATCQQLVQQGGSCYWNSDCEDGLICNGDDYCDQPIPDGGDCSSDIYSCGLLSGCYADTYTCGPLKQTGESCSYAYECQGRCDTDAGQCVDICGGTM
jgi:hypothetical protein